MNQDRKG